MGLLTPEDIKLAQSFPRDFTWGSATASYQVEGCLDQDGRAESIWDTYAHVLGNIADGSDGSVACEQYVRYEDDIKLMKQVDLDAYRMSIAWPRIFTELNGKPNQKAIDHYKRVLDTLRAADIKPVVTLYYWDLPQYLQDLGGWVNRDTASRFGDYAAVVAGALGDRVDIWTTLNEPWCSAYLGYAQGRHAPGIRDDAQALAAVHHLNLAHGLGVQAVRSELGDSAKTSVTLNLQVVRAASDKSEDLAAAQQTRRIGNEVWLGPMLEGKYDPQIFEDTREISKWEFIREGDLEKIHQPLNSLGINYYATQYVRAAVPENQSPDSNQREDPIVGGKNIEILPPSGPLTAMGWNQEPQGLTDILLEMSQRYPDLDLVVTENGSAWDDEVVEENGERAVHDPQRVHYLSQHLRACHDAIEHGAKLTGYFAWSLLDNYEWALGYTKRFGIFYVDYPTQKRIWKDTARWYQQFIKQWKSR
ncbi:GH1 family beta-glucosidase [Alloscardovia venturai]|uniref:Beta-glucosidase n=1 Tax=Alloscardovia venturai TaxID=1769421 RepID=A0ABW2YAG1_9BIFI